MERALAACIAILAGATSVSGAGLCRAWSQSRTLGALDPRVVSEASGLAASRERPRLYHVNDSGGGAFVYSSDLDGQGLRRLRIEGIARIDDPEALALGSLLGEPTLIVADIGDNLLRRAAIDFFAIRERAIHDDVAPVFAHVAARYPDGPHNAEAIAIGPKGAIYVFTKSWHGSSYDPAPSVIYRLPSRAWENPGAGPVTLERIAALDLPALAIRERAPLSDVVTDASMSEDGSRFLLLTYGYGWELALDLGAGAIPPTDELRRGRDYELIRLEPVLGKETITYLPGDRSFLYGKEFKPDSKPSNLMRLECLD